MIHVLPTDKPSRLFENSEGNLILSKVDYAYLLRINRAIYITSDEEIKEGDWCLDLEEYSEQRKNTEDVFVYRSVDEDHWDNKKIILTTDLELQKDGVQSINNDFLEWFVKNPSCEEVQVEKEQYHQFVGMKKIPLIPNYKIIIPKQSTKDRILSGTPDEVKYRADLLVNKEETVEEYFLENIKNVLLFKNDAQAIRFMEKYYQAKKEEERSYSEEEVLDILVKTIKDVKVKQLTFYDGGSEYPIYSNLSKWFEKYKKK